MRLSRWAVVSVLGVLALTGCTRKPEPPVLPVAPPPGLSQENRERLQKQNPGILFGSVVAVRSADQLVAVANIPATAAKVDDIVLFYASDQVINAGSVIGIVNGNLHVRYNEADLTKAERAPEIGDVVIKYPGAGK